MIHTRFDQIKAFSNRDEDTTIFRADLHQVPDVGQVVNIKGDPYIVRYVGWAISDDEDRDKYVQYAYVRIFPIS